MNILFSPIGNTDPIKGDLDGAMLHICRHYPIDMVIMYMSKDICVNHLRDNRYVRSLELLSAQTGREIGHEIIERPELENVQLFDFFIREFITLLSDIRTRFPQAEIYLNVSSGTPAMKSSLQILAAFREGEFTPLQVAGPGYTPPGYRPFDTDDAFENDLDNLEESENRCIRSSNLDLLTETKKKMLTALIDKYDYSGALVFAKDMTGLSEDFRHLLKAADLRSKFELDTARSEAETSGHEMTFYSEPAEYLLILWLKNERNEIADLLRAITPLMDVLYRRALKECCGFDVENYITERDSGDVWNMTKLRKSSDIAAAYDLLNAENSPKVGSFIFSKLVDKLSDDAELKAVFKALRKVEREARNRIAHQFISINRKDLHDLDLGSVNDILKALYSAALLTGALRSEDGGKKERTYFFEEYIRLNGALKKMLE